MIRVSKNMLHLGLKKSGLGLQLTDASGTSLYLIHQRAVKRISLNDNLTERKRTLYDVLGVSSKATQTEIKSAYYTLSMTFHPDKNANDAKAARTFREINEAYEILGSYLKRKRYDQGIFHLDEVSSTAKPSIVDHEEELINRKRDYRKRVPTHVGRTAAYNFDEWTKSHYGRTFQDSQAWRSKADVRSKSHELEQGLGIGLFYIVFMFMSFGVGAALFFDSKDYDNPRNN